MKASGSDKGGPPEGVVLAAIPLLGYACAFLYELAYAQRYDFPATFISIDLSRVLLVSGLIVGMAIPVTFMLSLLPRKPYLGIISLVLDTAPIWLVVWALAVIFHVWWPIWSAALALAICWTLFFVGIPIYQAQGGFIERAEAARKAYAAAAPQTLMTAAVDHAIDAGVQPRGWVYGYFITYGSLLIAWHGGRVLANNERYYLTTDTNPPLVVLRQYGDKFICGILDRQRAALRREWRIVPVVGRIVLSFGRRSCWVI